MSKIDEIEKLAKELRSTGGKAGRPDYGMFLSNERGDEIAAHLIAMCEALKAARDAIEEEMVAGAELPALCAHALDLIDNLDKSNE